MSPSLPPSTCDDPRVLGVVATSAATGDGIDELKSDAVRARSRERAGARRETRSLPTSSSTGRARLAGVASGSSARPGGYRVRGEATEEELRAAGVKPDAVVEFEDE